MATILSRPQYVNSLRPGDTSVKLAIISSENGLLPVQHQAIIWTNVGLLSLETITTILNEIKILENVWKFCLQNGSYFISALMW